MDDWYKITSAEIIDNGGEMILRKYRGSISKALQSAYPQHEWLLTKFVEKPRKFWDAESNKKKLVEWIGNQFQFKKLNEWYKGSFRNAPIFNNQGTVSLLLNVYPQWALDSKSFASRTGPKKASQRMLAVITQEIFPNSEVHEDYSDETLQFKSGRKMQIDVYLPKEKSCFRISRRTTLS